MIYGKQGQLYYIYRYQIEPVLEVLETELTGSSSLTLITALNFQGAGMGNLLVSLSCPSTFVYEIWVGFDDILLQKFASGTSSLLGDLYYYRNILPVPPVLKIYARIPIGQPGDTLVTVVKSQHGSLV